MGLTFYQLNNKKDDGQCTASSVPLIPKSMGLPMAEDPSWAFPSTIPNRYGLVKADYPRGKEDGSHVVIPYLYHLENFPNLIHVGWGGGSVSESKFTIDGVNAAFRHEFSQTIGAWICLLIKGGDTPKTFPLLSRAGGH